jgi:hypothetical protein
LRLLPPIGCRWRQLDPRFEVAVDHLALNRCAEEVVGEPELDPARLIQASEVLGR